MQFQPFHTVFVFSHELNLITVLNLISVTQSISSFYVCLLQVFFTGAEQHAYARCVLIAYISAPGRPTRNILYSRSITAPLSSVNNVFTQ